MPRTIEEQHTMVQYAIDCVREASELPSSKRFNETAAEMRNQEVQALTLIALELRELRIQRSPGVWIVREWEGDGSSEIVGVYSVEADALACVAEAEQRSVDLVAVK